MRYKREEALRYDLEQSIEIEIVYFNKEKEKISVQGEMIDLSPDGARITTNREIASIGPLTLSFTFRETSFYFTSNIAWDKQIGKTFIYGLNHQNDEDMQRKIIEKIKEDARSKLSS